MEALAQFPKPFLVFVLLSTLAFLPLTGRTKVPWPLAIFRGVPAFAWVVYFLFFDTAPITSAVLLGFGFFALAEALSNFRALSSIGVRLVLLTAAHLVFAVTLNALLPQNLVLDFGISLLLLALGFGVYFMLANPIPTYMSALILSAMFAMVFTASQALQGDIWLTLGGMTLVTAEGLRAWIRFHVRFPFQDAIIHLISALGLSSLAIGFHGLA